MSSKRSKQIKLVNTDMRFVTVHVEELIEGDVFDLIRTNRLTKQDFAAWIEHERDTWFAYGQNISNSS
jgi:hypothetical protein